MWPDGKSPVQNSKTAQICILHDAKRANCQFKTQKLRKNCILPVARGKLRIVTLRNCAKLFYTSCGGQIASSKLRNCAKLHFTRCQESKLPVQNSKMHYTWGRANYQFKTQKLRKQHFTCCHESKLQFSILRSHFFDRSKHERAGRRRRKTFRTPPLHIIVFRHLRKTDIQMRCTNLSTVVSLLLMKSCCEVNKRSTLSQKERLERALSANRRASRQSKWASWLTSIVCLFCVATELWKWVKGHGTRAKAICNTSSELIIADDKVS